MKYPYLDKIQKNGDVKKLPQQELPLLCEDIRNFLIESVSSTGGHLSSNLGVVELTVALHRALTLPQDKILFDVGHQCYTHKLLTGRREGFAHLRQVDGLSGFPSPQESDCDTFIAGHGSTALSTAIGVARAKKLKKEPGKVVAIIGDGAFTGGMVYEQSFCDDITAYVGGLAPVLRFPGEEEMRSLAEGALRVLHGQAQPREY